MERSFFVAIALLLLSYKVVAQQKPTLHGTLHAGLLEGERGTSTQIFLQGDVAYKTFWLGLGTGVDYYAIRSVPLYIQAGKNILNRPKTPFVYAAGGWHFPWQKKYDASLQPLPEPESGLYCEAGIGYALPVSNNTFLISLGYSYKFYSETSEYVLCPTFPLCITLEEVREYQLRRIGLKLGFRF